MAIYWTLQSHDVVDNMMTIGVHDHRTVKFHTLEVTMYSRQQTSQQDFGGATRLSAAVNSGQHTAFRNTSRTSPLRMKGL
jgi:hypothetical protein